MSRDHDPAPRKALRCAPRSGEVVNRCCGGRSLGPMSDDEDISAEDLERFGGVTRTCPECGTEVYDEAEICHNCGMALSASDSARSLPTWAVATIGVVVVLVAIGIMFM